MSRTPRLAIALVAVLATACGTVAPTVEPTLAPTAPPRPAGPTARDVDPAAAYAAIRAQVEALRGLEPTKAVDPVTIDEAQLETNFEAELAKEYPPDRLRFETQLLTTMGLLPEGSNLHDVLLDFKAGQVAGYYDPDEDKLFVVSRQGGVGGAELVTYAHEYTHQLQDQNFDLESLDFDAQDQRDRSFGRLALLEGDATSIQSTWMFANLTPEQLGDVLKAGLDPEAVAALQRAPAYIRETTLFTYQEGLAFVSQLLAGGSYDQVDAVYASPPASTEQILHPEKYVAHEAPDDVQIPDGIAGAVGSGWKVEGEDTLGEEVLGIWLRVGGVSKDESNDAAAGWGGDRLVLLSGPDGAASVGIVTTWDSAADAAEFASAAKAAMQALDPGGQVVSDGIRRVILTMGDGAADLLVALAG